MYESPTYDSELKNELSYDECLTIIDDFHTVLSHWNVGGKINFTGGDPFLKAGFFDILKYTNEKKISIGILGNPTSINYKTAKKLKELGVSRYQISIDGMEKTHDNLRGRKGAFQDAIRAIRILRDIGIPTVVMFTVSKINSNELIDVIRLVSNESVSIFDFARLVPIGHGKNIQKDMLTSQEYKKLLFQVLEEYKILQETGVKTYFGRKESLWTLLYQELGLVKPFPSEKDSIFTGCSMGWGGITILADGTILPCRRLPIEIGKAPNDSIKKIFIESQLLNEIRNYKKMQKCCNCELLQFCRGCPAVAFAVTGDFLSSDPQCWRIG